MDKERLKEMARDERFISGIYNYCDRWCERCPQTSHCLNYAMGEEEFADPESRDIQNKAFWEKMSQVLRTTLEMVKEEAVSRGIDLDALDFDDAEEESVQETAENHEISRAALAYSKMVEDWFSEAKSFFGRDGEAVDKTLLPLDESEPPKGEMEESLEVVRWYQHQIYVKMMRAISGRLREELEESDEEDLYAKDSDGSAKVALIGIDRSIAAWSVVGNGFPFIGRNDVHAILTHLERLRRSIEKDFPDARGFIRRNQNRRNGVGDHVPEDNPHVPQSQGARGRDEILLTQRQELGPDEPGGSHPAGEADHDHDIVDAGGEQGHHGQDQEEAGEAEHDVHQPHHQNID